MNEFGCSHWETSCLLLQESGETPSPGKDIPWPVLARVSLLQHESVNGWKELLYDSIYYHPPPDCFDCFDFLPQSEKQPCLHVSCSVTFSRIILYTQGKCTASSSNLDKGVGKEFSYLGRQRELSEEDAGAKRREVWWTGHKWQSSEKATGVRGTWFRCENSHEGCRENLVCMHC